MKAIACPQDSDLRRLIWIPAAKALLVAGAVTLVPCGAATGAPAQSSPPSPVIVPLDVTMEDTGWLETAFALARSAERHIAEPDAASFAVLVEAANGLPAVTTESSHAQLTPTDNEAPSGRLTLLAVPPDFSITVPAVAPPPGSATLAAPVNASVQSSPARGTGISRDQRKGQKRTYRVNGAAIEFDISVQLNGDLVGQVPLKTGADRNVLVQLAGLLALLQDRMDPQLHDWLGSAYSVNSHISFDQLRSAGIDVRYDAANDIVVMTAN